MSNTNELNTPLFKVIFPEDTSQKLKNWHEVCLEENMDAPEKLKCIKKHLDSSLGDYTFKDHLDLKCINNKGNELGVRIEYCQYNTPPNFGDENEINQKMTINILSSNGESITECNYNHDVFSHIRGYDEPTTISQLLEEHNKYVHPDPEYRTPEDLICKPIFEELIKQTQHIEKTYETGVIHEEKTYETGVIHEEKTDELHLFFRTQVDKSY